MANKNAGTQIRFENGGTILIGADTLLNIVKGSLNFKVPGYEPKQTYDRGQPGAVIAGDLRCCEGSLDLSYTSPIDADGVLTALVGALSADKIANVTAAGLIFTFSMTVKVPDGLGVATGDQYAFTGVYLDPAFDYQAGDEVDVLKCAFKCNNGGPAITRY
ncbi:MAG TPA: hypothetical protein VFF65_07625 [Phycisphaerales bacterium]|nr:hypothetical protein [Phycisphaerales bacterium]